MDRRIIICAGALAALAAGSWALDQQASAEETATGVIAGVVEFAGTPPQRAPLERKTDPMCAKITRLDERLVVTGGKLRDVHVRIKSGTAGAHAAATTPAEITQLECMYTPRVVGVMAGQTLAINNGDPTYHNVRGAKGKRTVWNLAQPARAPAIVRDNLGKAGEVVSLHCDVHPWMRAYAVITDHPFFAVTGDSGAFTIPDVPAGTYTLEAWHPELGLETTQVTVKRAKTAKVVFRFE